MWKRWIVGSTLGAIALFAAACSTDRGTLHRLDDAVAFAPPPGFLRVPCRAKGPGARGAVFENVRTDVAGRIRIEIVPFAGLDEPGCARSHEDLARHLSRAAGSPRRGTLVGRQAAITELKAHVSRASTDRQFHRSKNHAFFLDENSVVTVHVTAGSEEMLEVMETSLRSLELRTKPLDDDDLVPQNAREAVDWFASTRPARRIVGEACIPTFGADSIEPMARALRAGKLDPLAVSVWPLLARIGEPAVEGLIELVSSGSAVVRKEAIEALGEIGDERAVGPLIESLESERAARTAVIEALGKLRAAGAVQPLIGSLSSDEPPHRAAAAEALGRIGDRRALSELLRVAGSDTGAPRIRAIRALGGIGAPEVLDELESYLDDDDEEVRDNAVAALGSMHDPDAVRALCGAAGHESPATRSHAAQRLAATDFAAALHPLLECLESDHGAAKAASARALGRLRADVSDRLAPLITDERKPVRAAAFAALPRIGDARAIQVLWRALVDGNPLAGEALAAAGTAAIPTLGAGLEHGDAAVRRAAATALARIGGSAATGFLLGALSDPDEGVGRISTSFLGKQDELDVDSLVQILRGGAVPARRRAARLLGSLRQAEAVDPLLEALDDSDSPLRLAAIRALGILRDPRAAEKLLSFLSHEELSNAAAIALSKIRPPVVTQIVARLAAGTEVERSRAIQVLESLAGIDEPPALLDPLLAAMGDPAGMVRATAASAAGALGDPAVVGPLIELVDDPDPLVRTNAVAALGALRASAAADRLIALSGDSDESLRRIAVGALGRIDDVGVIDSLIEALADTSVAVRLLAIEGLWKHQDLSAVTPLLELLGDPDVRIRRAATEALGRIGEVSALAPLLAVLADDTDVEVRTTAATALGLIGDSGAIEPLQAAMNGANPQVERAARWALVQLTGAFDR